MYPNPTTTFIQVNLIYPGNIISKAIFDALGQRIFDQTFTGNSPLIDVSGLTPGLFFIRISDGPNAGMKGFLKQ